MFNKFSGRSQHYMIFSYKCFRQFIYHWLSNRIVTEFLLKVKEKKSVSEGKIFILRSICNMLYEKYFVNFEKNKRKAAFNNYLIIEITKSI